MRIPMGTNTKRLSRGLLAAFAACVVLVACSAAASANRPSDPEIESKVRAALLSDGKDKVMTVENFKKLNGILNQDGSYVAEVSYDLVFSKSYQQLKEQYDVDESKAASQLGPLRTFLLTFYYANSAWQAGQHFPRTQNVPFIKSEKGWIIDGDLD